MNSAGERNLATPPRRWRRWLAPRRDLPSGPVLVSRLLLALVLASPIVVFVVLDASAYFNVEAIRSASERAATLMASHPIRVAAAFFLFYVAATALSVPGAILSSIAAGAVFGLLPGLVLVSVAATLGAGCAFLAARYLLRDWVESNWSGRLRIVIGLNGGGLSWLVALRLNPAIPFFVVNWAMGLTHMRLLPFCIGSQLGMLPVLFVYVNAGAQLPTLLRTADILSPGVITSLLLLSVLPLASRYAATRLRKRRVGRPCRVAP